MQTSKQHYRLLREFESEPFRTWALLAKCGAGLAVVALIALIGLESPGDPEQVARAKEAATTAARPAQEHRRQVFNERRQRFNEDNSPGNIAGRPARPANRFALLPQ